MDKDIKLNKTKGNGLRFNDGKNRHDLIPAFAQEQYAKVMTLGAKKYADRNWEKGMPWTTVMASLERHLQAFKRGEDFDPETGLLHTAHIICNAAYLTEYYRIYPEGDDRPLPYLNVSKIMIDIDEVICDWVSAWVAKFNMEVPKSWFFDRNILKRMEEMDKNGDLEVFYANLSPKVAPEDIPFEPLGYVTSRPVKTSITEEWLDKNGFPTRPVHTVGVDKSKVDVLKENGCEIFVDDRYDNFVEINNAGIMCYLMDTPHNRRYDVGHRRIFHLSDLITGNHLNR